MLRPLEGTNVDHSMFHLPMYRDILQSCQHKSLQDFLPLIINPLQGIRFAPFFRVRCVKADIIELMCCIIGKLSKNLHLLNRHDKCLIIKDKRFRSSIYT